MGSFRRRKLATSLIVAGFLAFWMSLGGGWGAAYGQTAGPTPTVADADLAVTKEASVAQARPGSTVTFTIRVQNTGGAPALNVVARDDVPSAFEVISATASSGTVATSGPTVTLTIPQLNPGESAVLTIVTRLRPDALGQLTNDVVASAARMSGERTADRRASASLNASEDAPDAAAGGSAGAAGSSGDVSSQLSNTGADGSVVWWLLAVGIVLISVGGTLIWRTRRAG